MKIKYLFLLLILTGIIISSGCADAEAQPFTSKVSANLYRSIFYPYPGLLGQGVSGIPEGHPYPNDPYPHNPYPERPSGDSNPERPALGPTQALREATALLDSNIEKAEEISRRLEFGIRQLEAEGKDVSRLQELFEEYRRLIGEAKQYRALADTDSGEESRDKTQREHLARSQESMIQANLVLKEIFGEFQSFMPGSEQLNETARLSAKGRGKAVLTGSFTLKIHLENGVMAILDLSRDSAIYIKGDYTFEEQTEGPHTVLLYNIRSADVEIPGSGKAVLLNAANISLTAAKGKGQVTFFGNGTYTIEDADGKQEKTWANSLIEMNVINDKTGPDKMPPTELRDMRTGMHKTGPGLLI